MKRLVIVGDSAFAEVAYEYFTYDSQYEVVAFAVEKAFLKKKSLFSIPVVAFEDLPILYPSECNIIFVAIIYTQLNRLRTRLYKQLKNKGYRFASYISPKAFIWNNCSIGEHCFIFENNTIQPFVNIGNNVILWSGNHIGHHSIIGNNCFISSQVVISGFCNIGDNCFLGVNSTIANNVVVGSDCFLGAGTLLSRNSKKFQVFKGDGSVASKINSLKFFKINDDLG